MEHDTNELIQEERQGKPLEDEAKTLFSDWNLYSSININIKRINAYKETNIIIIIT